MGILILTVLGALLGWLGTIVTRREDRQSILVFVTGGIAGSLVAGIISGGANLFAGVGAQQLLWSALGAVIAAFAANLLRERVFR